MDPITWLATYLRQRQCQALCQEIAALHPELNHLEGEAKIEYYMKSCFRYYPHQRNHELRSAADFNEAGSNRHPLLRQKALSYLSTRSAEGYHFDLLQAQMQNQDLTAEVERLRLELMLKDQLVDEAKVTAQNADNTIRQINLSVLPEARQN